MHEAHEKQTQAIGDHHSYCLAKLCHICHEVSPALSFAASGGSDSERVGSVPGFSL